MKENIHVMMTSVVFGSSELVTTYSAQDMFKATKMLRSFVS